jgi:hypothetical protein
VNLLYAYEVAAVVSELAVFTFPKQTPDANPATAMPETPAGIVGPGPVQIGLGTVLVQPGGPLASNDVNFATVQVFKRTGGGPPVLVAQATTQTIAGGGTGDWTPWKPVPIPLAAAAFVSPGDAVTVEIGKTGAGVDVPALVLAGFVRTD